MFLNWYSLGVWIRDAKIFRCLLGQVIYVFSIRLNTVYYSAKCHISNHEKNILPNYKNLLLSIKEKFNHKIYQLQAIVGCKRLYFFLYITCFWKCYLTIYTTVRRWKINPIELVKFEYCFTCTSLLYFLFHNARSYCCSANKQPSYCLH